MKKESVERHLPQQNKEKKTKLVDTTSTTTTTLNPRHKRKQETNQPHKAHDLWHVETPNNNTKRRKEQGNPSNSY